MWGGSANVVPNPRLGYGGRQVDKLNGNHSLLVDTAAMAMGGKMAQTNRWIFNRPDSNGANFWMVWPCLVHN